MDHRRNASHFERSRLDCIGKRFSNRKGKRKHENKIVRHRACCERGHDCSSEPRRFSRSERGISQRRSCTQCPCCSRSDASRRCFIVPLDADAVTWQQTVLFRPTPFLVWDAFVTCLRVPAAFLFESRFVHAFRSIHRSNYPATQSCRAIRESQKSSCRTRVEPAKHRNAVPEWKQSTECKQSPESKQSAERKQFPKWKQSSAARLAKTRFRSPIRELASRLEPQLRPPVEWPPMLLH